MATEKEPSWAEWVESFNTPAPTSAVAPMLPVGPDTAALSAANRANIGTLFDPTFGRDEQIRAGAEAAISGGWGAGGFAQNQTNRLLDSERKANFVLGAQLLEPYLQRDFQGAEGAADRAARLNQIAAEGAQALQRLQLSEAGATARLNTETASALTRAVLAGQQAMQQITLREAGETGRQRTAIQGSLAETLLRAGLSGAGKSSGGGGGGDDGRIRGPMGGGTYFMGNPNLSGVGVGPLYNDSRAASWEAISGGRPVAESRPLGLGSSSIDKILRSYGLLP